MDQDVKSFVDHWIDRLAAELAPTGFVGAYLHGSLAMGSFYRPKSDIDILFVVEAPLTPEQRQAAAVTMCELSDRRPQVGDLEMSVLRRSDTANFHQPMPFEVHYSAEWKQAILGSKIDFETQRTDRDLASYCTAVRARGVCLTGEPISAVFGPVPAEANRDAVLYDLDWVLENDRMVERPVYGVLNCCRVLALRREGWDRALSKEEGGEWALRHVPEQYRPLIAQALACYRSPEPVQPDQRRTDGHGWDEEALRAFRDYIQTTFPGAWLRH